MLLRASLFLGSLCLACAQQAEQNFQWPAGKRGAVSLSFDDARLSQIDMGTPLFDRHGVKVTFYVTPRGVEKRLEGWKKAAARGHEIGNHSNTHPCTANFGFSLDNAVENYTLKRIQADLRAADAEIERLLGVKPATFAYPCGQKFVGRGVRVRSYVPVVAKRFLAGRGFRDEAANNPAVCDLAQVLGVDSDGLSFEQMREQVAGATAQGRWLVFAGHEIGKPGHQTTDSEALDQLLRWAADPANGIWLDTVEAIASYIRQQRAALN